MTNNLNINKSIKNNKNKAKFLLLYESNQKLFNYYKKQIAQLMGIDVLLIKLFINYI